MLILKTYNDYVPPKVRKAMEETMHFVCTTTDKIVKNTKEFVQNVDWKKVAIGVGTTLAVTAAVVATGGAAAPVLIGAAVGAGASTGVSIVSGAIQGKSPAEIAKDSSDAFMWGAIGGSFGGGTTSVLKSTGKSAANSFVKQNLIEGGVDTVVDLSETAVRNDGELTGKDIVKSVASNIGGALINAPDTPSTTRNQIVDNVDENYFDDVVEVTISKNKYPESAQHIEEAIKSGQPDILTINRDNAKSNRKDSLKGIETVPGKDRDEYPPAMFNEGGEGASVKHISQSDNRGAGSTIGNQLRQYPNGTKVKIVITD